MEESIKEEIFNVGLALIAIAQADGEISRGELGLIESIVWDLDEEGENKYTGRLEEELKKKQDLKDILPRIKSEPAKALLLYETSLLVFADTELDPEEVTSINQIIDMIEFDKTLKERALKFIYAGKELVEVLQEAVS